jgi:hypothetical protein
MPRLPAFPLLRFQYPPRNATSITVAASKRIPKFVCAAIFLLATSIPVLGQKKPGQPAADTVAQTSSAYTCDPNNLTSINSNFLFVEATKKDYELARQIVWKGSGFDTTIPTLDSGSAYIFLLTRWTTDGKSYTLLASSWYVYRVENGDLVQMYARTSGNGLLLPYGAKSVNVVGVELVNVDSPPATLAVQKTKLSLSAMVTYTTSITQGTKQNVSNLGAILGGLAGVPAPKGPLFKVAVPPPVPACVQAFTVKGQPDLPFNLSVGLTWTPGTVAGSGPPKDASSATVINCSSTTDKQPCNIARTFTSVDKEWWDVSIGVNAFGTRETKFDSTGKTSSVTRNTDPYVFFTLFPTFWWLPKDGPVPVSGIRWLSVPHLDVGIPVKKQPLHRPFFGAAEKIPKSDKIFGIPIYFTGGVVRLIESVPNGNNGLRQHVVWKSMFGFEFSGSTLLSKLTGK